MSYSAFLSKNIPLIHNYLAILGIFPGIFYQRKDNITRTFGTSSISPSLHYRMSPFDNHEYAVKFFEPYALIVAQAIEQAFILCQKEQDYYTSNEMFGEWVDYPTTYKTQRLHYFVGNQLALAFRNHEDVRVLKEIGSTELLFKGRMRLRVNKVKDDLTFCTNNDTKREQAYRNPSAGDGSFDFAVAAPIYAGYRMNGLDELRDIYLIKYDHNEKQWHVKIDGSDASSIQTMTYEPIVPKPIVTPEEEPQVTRKKIA
jgi:hypothetical protein